MPAPPEEIEVGIRWTAAGKVAKIRYLWQQAMAERAAGAPCCAWPRPL